MKEKKLFFPFVRFCSHHFSALIYFVQVLLSINIFAQVCNDDIYRIFLYSQMIVASVFVCLPSLTYLINVEVLYMYTFDGHHQISKTRKSVFCWKLTLETRLITAHAFYGFLPANKILLFFFHSNTTYKWMQKFKTHT